MLSSKFEHLFKVPAGLIFVSEKKQLSLQNDENDQNINVKVPRGLALKQTKTKARFERHVIISDQNTKKEN